MSIKIFILSLLILTVTVSQNTTTTCHYSCETCAGTSYTLCLTCANGNNLTVVQNPDLCQAEYLNSNSPSGICIQPLSPKLNAWGIVIILVCTAIIIGIHTPQSLYLYSALQTLALISFVQIAWLNPVGYLLQALQFFMIFNWIQSPYKIQDQTMLQRQYYRLDLYFHQSYFISNFAIIGIFVIIVFILCVGLAIWKYKKDKKYQQNIMLEGQGSSNKQQHKQKSQKHIQQVQQSQISQRFQYPHKNQQTLIQKILQIMLKVCLSLFYFTIQQCSLIIMVGLRFQRPLPMSTKAIPIIYCILLLTFMVYTFIYKLWFFPNKQSQFFNIWRKIGLPVLTIVPYSITYLIVVFMLLFIIFESFFDYKGGNTKLLSRLTFYKLVQLINIIFAGAYILTQLNRNIQLQSNIIRIFYAIAILAFLACLIIVEFIIGFYYTYFKNNNQIDNNNLPQNSVQSRNGDSNSRDGHNRLNNTEQTINQINNNIFTQPQDNNKNVVIYDLEDQDHQKNGKNGDLNGIQQHGQNMTDTRKKIIQGGQKDDKNLHITTSETRKNLKNSDNSKNKNFQDQNKHDLDNENGKIKSKDDRNDQNKSNHNNKNHEQSEQQKRNRKKRQQQQQAEQKARKKRKYIAQMDPQLRKRYGF